MNYLSIKHTINQWAQELGFEQIGVSDLDLSQAEQRLSEWLAKGFAGNMGYLSKHGRKRTHPDELVPNTIRVIMLRMNYQPETRKPKILFSNKNQAYIARYALGRDYHKLMRKRLKKLCEQITRIIPTHQYRVFADSAPVLEKPLAAKAGLGWQGKNTLLINQEDGSYFFLGTIYTNLPLPVDEPVPDQCGACQACINICPTQAIVAPYILDARRCISYLTIEHKDSIPVEFRQAIGNRIFGCDDCQIICPWNRYAKNPRENGFHPKSIWQQTELTDLFAWTEEKFLHHAQGTVLHRTGYECWLRNLAIALGNASNSTQAINALRARQEHPSVIVREHVAWALEQHSKNR